MNRTQRLLELVNFLMNARGPISFRRVKEAFPDYQAENDESARRKFERDKETLRELGIVIQVVPDEEMEGSEGAAYLVDTEETFLPPVEFEEDEVLALLLLSRVARRIDHFPLKRDTDQALRKILYDRQDDPEADVPAGPLVRLPDLARNPRQSEWLQTIHDAILQRRTLQTRYHTFWSDELKARKIDPYGLVYQAGRWSLVGRCHLREDTRVFLVERFRDVRVAPRKGSKPDYEIPPGFDVRKTVRTPPWLWEGTRPVEIEIAFSPRIAWQVAKSHGDAGAFETLPDGRGRLTVSATNPEALIHWILGFGPDARILRPADVVEGLVGRVRGILSGLEKTPEAARPKGRGTRRTRASREGSKDRPRGRKPTAAAEATRTHAELERLLTMIPYLYENGRVPVEEVAVRFGLTREEVVEAINRIAMLGDELLEPHQLVDAYIEEGHVEIQLPPAVRRPIRLSARQALSLLAGAACLRAEGLPISPPLERAVEKVRGATPRAERERLRDLENAITIAQEGEGLGETLRRLDQARRDRQTMEIEYLSTTGSGITTRRIDPYLLWNHSGFWYCASWCHLREETRTFRLSRIRSVRETAERFEPVADFDASKYGEGPVYIPPKDALPVRVRFAPSAARLVEEREGEAVVARGSDGSVTVLTLASTPAWVVSWLLPYGDAATILEPEAAREAMREAAIAVLREYGDEAADPKNGLIAGR